MSMVSAALWKEGYFGSMAAFSLQFFLLTGDYASLPRPIAYGFN